jgi:hypothetical protein
MVVAGLIPILGFVLQELLLLAFVVLVRAVLDLPFTLAVVQTQMVLAVAV